jgi:hypothetical protein
MVTTTPNFVLLDASECSGYEDGDEVTIEVYGQWYGVDMMCVSDPHGRCYWIPTVDLQGGDHDFGAARRR